MSSMAPDTDALRRRWIKRIEAGLNARKPFERTWASNRAFLHGQQHLEWHTRNRRLELPPLAPGRKRYTADVTTQYRNHAVGELSQGDDRPELLFRRDDAMAEDFASQVNRAMGFGWDSEWQGDPFCLRQREGIVSLGTMGGQVVFDPTKGPTLANVPHDEGGKPILDPAKAHDYVAKAQAEGRSSDHRDIHEGRIAWRVLYPENLIVPPGIFHEDDFPWEVVVRPIELQALIEEFPEAAGLKADEDIGSVIGDQTDTGQNTSEPIKLADHVWLYACHDRPCRLYPNGAVTYLAGKDKKFLTFKPTLPWTGPDGTPSAGISYFHFWRVEGRFWSKSLIEVIKEPQRAINERGSQISEIIERSAPYVIAEEGTQGKKTNRAFEILWMKRGQTAPQPVQGTGVGAWMYQDIERIIADLERAVGFRAASLGDAAGAANYSQLALQRENDQIKFRSVRENWETSITRMVEPTVDAIRKHWPPQKQIALVGDEDQVEAFEFNAANIPPFFLVRMPQGAAKPRSQAAEIKISEDIARYSVESQQPLPVTWLATSYERGQAQPIPEGEADVQSKKAELENQIFADKHLQIEPVYYDNPEVHIPEHRKLQIQAELTGQPDLWDLIEEHVQAHKALAMKVALENAQEQATIAQATAPPPQPAPDGSAPPAAPPQGA